MNKLVRLLAGALTITLIQPVAHAVSKEAQELMKLREKYAPVNCELTKLYRQRDAAHKAGDKAKVRELTARMQELDKKLSPDQARMAELRKRVRGTPDYPVILQQQVKFDKACNPPSRKP
jgi:uncharacterized coiled-coil DUF342 family protein